MSALWDFMRYIACFLTLPVLSCANDGVIFPQRKTCLTKIIPGIMHISRLLWDVMNYKEIIPQITERLSTIEPYKALLFGSFADGEPGPDSDIDLIVVLNKRGFPASYGEKMENYRSIRRLLRDINIKAPIDVIVYTIDEWNAFVEIGSSFSRLVIEKGKAIA
jgi:uncharacterized protein